MRSLAKFLILSWSYPKHGCHGQYSCFWLAEIEKKSFPNNSLEIPHFMWIWQKTKPFWAILVCSLPILFRWYSNTVPLEPLVSFKRKKEKNSVCQLQILLLIIKNYKISKGKNELISNWLKSLHLYWPNFNQSDAHIQFNSLLP